MRPIQTIIAAQDFSEHAEAALDVAAELAGRLGASLHLLHVVQPPSFSYSPVGHVGTPLSALHMHQDAERRLEDIAEHLPQLQERAIVHVVEGSVVGAAIDEVAIAIEADMIVMGTHGRSGLGHLLHGSVTERALRHSPCPVLAVPLPATALHAGEYLRPAIAPSIPW